MRFYLAGESVGLGVDPRNAVQLVPSRWDDYSYKTQFTLRYMRGTGDYISLGAVKIGYRNQPHGWTKDAMAPEFSELPEGWFSVGLDVEFYKELSLLPVAERDAILLGLRDVAFSEEFLRDARAEDVYLTSLLRDVSEAVVVTQYRRVLRGEAILTDYIFSYSDVGAADRSPVDLAFRISAGSKPPTNIHVLIGRNGIGKTTILNGMVAAVHSEYQGRRTGQFSTGAAVAESFDSSEDFFSGIVSVSFSAFDPFLPPPDNLQPSRGPKYAYIGLKKGRSGGAVDASLKSEPDLINEFIEAYTACMSQDSKRERWLRALNRLESDVNFSAMNLCDLAIDYERSEELAIRSARNKVARMSSGHKIVLLTITALVNLVEEKTLVLLDEPESHLHPPLLSAFTRALSELLHDRNGVAIVATHSPVVVQEVPKICVWKIMRSGLEWRRSRPARETFGESVGELTKEVFGLEVSKSGFHATLQEEVDAGKSLQQIRDEFNDRIGMEGLSILMSMIAFEIRPMGRL
ncbi:AAA family ATPase [Stenotrophomonas sp. VV52]|uniref:AAA family ATPase n=1 Tax=Stenotrophomonas sp. VV52 TaxID=2066958 RepID=UPI000C9DE54C|nr:AAA family ATPase [Stenotrophomonas sp. VV52]